MTGKISPGEDVRLAQASDWLARLSREDHSDDDAVAFDSWLQADPSNARAYDDAAATWNAFGASAQAVLAEIAAVDRRRARPGFLGRGLDRRALIGGGVGMAAAAAVAIAVLPGALLDRSAETYSTVKGQHRTVTLADGSTIDLNAETSLTVTLARAERRVVMGEGEAIFDVAADKARPFTIQAGGHTVRVVGTQFDVRNRPDGLAVTVTRGVVEVRSNGEGGPGDTYVLRPGQKLDLGKNGTAQLTVATSVEALGWRTGRVVYRAVPLSRVVDDLNHQFNRPIRIADPELADMRVSGVLVVDTQPQVIERLTLMFPLTAIPSDQGVLLRRK